jgi:hypothetical protein
LRDNIVQPVANENKRELKAKVKGRKNRDEGMNAFAVYYRSFGLNETFKQLKTRIE